MFSRYIQTQIAWLWEHFTLLGMCLLLMCIHIRGILHFSIAKGTRVDVDVLVHGLVLLEGFFILKSLHALAALEGFCCVHEGNVSEHC